MRTISFTLDPDSIDDAIRQVREYAAEIEAKTEQLRKMIAERIHWSASEGFRTAVTSDVIGVLVDKKVYSAEPYESDVTVTITHSGDVSVIFAEGKDAVFIEYGAGVYHNGAAGSSPHPWGEQYGYFIGSYGKGHGQRRAWGFRDETGKVVLTHGTPAAMPMFRGMTEAIGTIREMAQEVFG